MKRVFRDEIKNELIKNANDGVRQWDNFQRDLSSWINKYSEYADPYLKSSLNIYTSDLNTVLLGGKTRIEKIFRDVESVETSYSNSFSDVATEMTLYTAKINALRNAVKPIGGVNAFESNIFDTKFKIAKNKLDKIWEDEILALIDNPDRVSRMNDSKRESVVEYISGKYRGKDIKEVPIAERDLLIICYEVLTSENKEKMDDFLEPLKKYDEHDEDIQNIKYLSYASPEPYHSVFFKYLSELKLMSYNADSQMSFVGAVFVDLNPDPEKKEGLYDPRGAYSTFFHEVGHGIDFAMSKVDRVDGFDIVDVLNPSTSYALNDLVYADVENGIRQGIEKVGEFEKPISLEDEEKIQIIFDSLKRDGIMKDSDPLYETRKKVQNHFFKNILNEAKNNGASDVYGGVTGYNVNGDYGHQNNPGYWDIFHPSLEFFADSFSVNMTQYSVPLESMNKNLPTASKAFQEIMENDRNRGK